MQFPLLSVCVCVVAKAPFPSGILASLYGPLCDVCERGVSLSGSGAYFLGAGSWVGLAMPSNSEFT